MRPVNLVGIGPRGRFSSFLNPGLAPFFPFGGAGGPKSRARARRTRAVTGRPWPPEAARTRAAEASAWTAGTRTAGRRRLDLLGRRDEAAARSRLDAGPTTDRGPHGRALRSPPAGVP